MGARPLHGEPLRGHLRDSPPRGYTTILKLLQIMADKGLVKRDERRQAHVYRAVPSPAQTHRNYVGYVLLAHVRRYDVLINIIQTTMETLFSVNPAIWWISLQTGRIGDSSGPVGPDCEAGDCDGDGDVDCDDWACFELVWTDAAPGPQLPACHLAGIPDFSGPGARMHAAPNPMDANHSTTIAYSARTSGPVTVAVCDVGGRRVRTLTGGVQEPGDYSIRRDGRGENGAVVPSGVYWVRVDGRGRRPRGGKTRGPLAAAGYMYGIFRGLRRQPAEDEMPARIRLGRHMRCRAHAHNRS